jgi:hypothetical protein
MIFVLPVGLQRARMRAHPFTHLAHDAGLCFFQSPVRLDTVLVRLTAAVCPLQPCKWCPGAVAIVPSLVPPRVPLSFTCSTHSPTHMSSPALPWLETAHSTRTAHVVRGGVVCSGEATLTLQALPTYLPIHAVSMSDFAQARPNSSFNHHHVGIKCVGAPIRG